MTFAAKLSAAVLAISLAVPATAATALPRAATASWRAVAIVPVFGRCTRGWHFSERAARCVRN